MSEPYFYSASGKWYRTKLGKVVPSAGTLCTLITKENYDHVGIESLERAIQQGEGAHRVACDYSLHVLGHLATFELPPMPAGHPATEEQWDAAMALALDQVIQLFNKYDVEPIAVEEPDVCSTYGFGGQPDLKCFMKWQGRRIKAVWDYKRVAAISLSHKIKIPCYQMLDGYQDCASGFIAWLHKDGPAKLIHVPKNLYYISGICGQAAVINLQISEGILKP